MCAYPRYPIWKIPIRYDPDVRYLEPCFWFATDQVIVKENLYKFSNIRVRIMIFINVLGLDMPRVMGNQSCIRKWLFHPTLGWAQIWSVVDVYLGNLCRLSHYVYRATKTRYWRTILDITSLMPPLFYDARTWTLSTDNTMYLDMASP